MGKTEKDFIELLNQNQKIIHKVCNLYMNWQEDKEDLFQEITLQAWKAFNQFRGDAKFSTTSAKGNGHRGGSLLEVEGDIGKKYSDSSWRAKVNLTYTMDQESKSASNSNNVSKRDAYTSLGTLFTYQWIVNPTFAFNLSGGLGFMGEIDTKNSFNKENNVIDSGTLVTIGVNFLLNATPNLMFDIGLTGTSAGGQDLTATDTSTNVAVLLTNESTSIGMLSLAAKYEF